LNYLITTLCPKKCPYCFFPSKQKGTIEDMTLETFKECFEHQAKIGTGIGRRVALLGGEPTVAKHFQDIVGFILDNLFRVNFFILFSNLSGVENIRWLMQHNFGSIDARIIWNSTGLTSYASNLKKKVYQSLSLLKGSDIKVTASITMEADQDPKDFEYLLEAKKEYGISDIRFALDSGNLPEFRTKGTAVYRVLKFLYDHNFSIGIDGCGSPSFKIFNAAQADFVSRINGVNVDCPGSAGIDILPNGTCIPCMPYLSYKGDKPKFIDLKCLDDLKTIYGFSPRDRMLCPAIANIDRLNLKL
jgi:MoaA/NifB/PqqE/SkfB family radical SAM enzyme